MDTRFDTADMCEQICAGKASVVEALSETIARIDNFDETNAVVAGDFERALEEAKLLKRSRTSYICAPGGEAQAPFEI